MVRIIWKKTSLIQKKEKEKEQMTTKLIKQNLEELKKQTLLSLLSTKGVIWTYYKRKLCHRDMDSSLEIFLGIKGRAEKQ